MCLGDGLKMCICFVNLFYKLNLVIFQALLHSK